MTPMANLLLLKDFKPGQFGVLESDLATLHGMLTRIPGFEHVILNKEGESTVAASVPARTERDRAKLKSIVSDRVPGWQVIEPSIYRVPTIF